MPARPARDWRLMAAGRAVTPTWSHTVRGLVVSAVRQAVSRVNGARAAAIRVASGPSVIGVVINPLARRHRRDPAAADRLRDIVGAHGIVTESRSLDDLEGIARTFADRGVDVLAVGGGDGTNALTLSVFHRVWGARTLPRLALLRGGTMNTVANAVGVPRGRPETLLRWLVGEVARGEPLRSVQKKTLDVDGRLGFLFGTGVIHGFLAEYYRDGDPFPTPWTAFTTLARGSGSAFVRGERIRRIAKPFVAQLVVDGERWAERSYLSVAAGTVPQIGLGFRPFYRVDEREDAFHLLGIHTSAVGFVLALPKVRVGRAMGDAKVREALACELVVTTPDGVVEFTVDGDLHRVEGPLRVRLGPRVEILEGRRAS